MGRNVNSVGDLEKHTEVDSQSGCIYYLSVSNRSSNRDILDCDCDRPYPVTTERIGSR